MPEELFILSIIGIVFGWLALKSILTAIFGAERMGVRSRHAKHLPKPSHDDATIKRLESQVAMLIDRVKVLERITVEEGSSLAAEIERLREPEQLGYGGSDDLTAPRRSPDRV